MKPRHVPICVVTNWTLFESKDMQLREQSCLSYDICFRGKPQREEKSCGHVYSGGEGGMVRVVN